MTANIICNSTGFNPKSTSSKKPLSRFSGGGKKKTQITTLKKKLQRVDRRHAIFVRLSCGAVALVAEM